jgi:hypothetical protein
LNQHHRILAEVAEAQEVLVQVLIKMQEHQVLVELAYSLL